MPTEKITQSPKSQESKESVFEKLREIGRQVGFGVVVLEVMKMLSPDLAAADEEKVAAIRNEAYKVIRNPDVVKEGAKQFFGKLDIHIPDSNMNEAFQSGKENLAAAGPAIKAMEDRGSRPTK